MVHEQSTDVPHPDLAHYSSVRLTWRAQNNPSEVACQAVLGPGTAIRQLRARHAPKSRYFEGRPERAEIAGSQGVRAVGCLPVGDPKLPQVIPGGREPRRAINEREEALDPAVGQ